MAKIKPLSTGYRWGDWFLNAERLLLEYRPGAQEYRDNDNWTYYVPIRGLNLKWNLDDWHRQLSEKTWVTPSILSDFFSAVKEIFTGTEEFDPVCDSFYRRRFKIMSDDIAEEQRRIDEAQDKEDAEREAEREEQAGYEEY